MSTRRSLCAVLASMLLASFAHVAPAQVVALLPSSAPATTTSTPVPVPDERLAQLESRADRGDLAAMVALIAHQLDIREDRPYFDRYHRAVAQAMAAGDPDARALALRIVTGFPGLRRHFLAATRASRSPDDDRRAAGADGEQDSDRADRGEDERARDRSRERDRDRDRDRNRDRDVTDGERGERELARDDRRAGDRERRER